MPDPTPPNGGPPGPGAEPPPKHPDLQRPPVGPPQVRKIELEQSTYDELVAFRVNTLARDERLETERLEALAKATKSEELLAGAVKQWETKYKALEAEKTTRERAWLDEKKNTAIAQALEGRTYVGQDPAKTAALVRRLLAEEIEAGLDPQGSPTVYDRVSRRNAADYLRERLESPELAIFFVASTRGGSGADGTRSAGTPQPQQPGSVEAIAARYRDQVKPGFGLTRVS